MNKKDLIPKEGLFGDDFEPTRMVPIHIFIVVVCYLSYKLIQHLPQYLFYRILSVILLFFLGFSALSLIVKFIHARYDNSTRQRWLNTCTSHGWIKYPAYGLLQFENNGKRYFAYVGILGRVVVLCKQKGSKVTPDIPKEMFHIQDGQIVLLEEDVRRLGFKMSYNGDLVRVYENDTFVYCDPGGEEELAMYRALL